MFTMGPPFPKIIKGVRSNMFHLISSFIIRLCIQMLNCTSGQRIHETARTFNKSASKISRRTNSIKASQERKNKGHCETTTRAVNLVLFKKFCCNSTHHFFDGFVSNAICSLWTEYNIC